MFKKTGAIGNLILPLVVAGPRTHRVRDSWPPLKRLSKHILAASRTPRRDRLHDEGVREHHGLRFFAFWRREGGRLQDSAGLEVVQPFRPVGPKGSSIATAPIVRDFASSRRGVGPAACKIPVSAARQTQFLFLIDDPPGSKPSRYVYGARR